MNNIAPSIMFHHFCDEYHPRGQGAITADELTELIAWVGRENILSATEWLDHVRFGTLPQNKICLTFDDCLRCQYDVALPVLEATGLTAFWFVYSGHWYDGIVPLLEIYRYFRTVYYPDIEDFYATFFAAAEARFGTGVSDWLVRFDRSQFSEHVYPDYYSLNDCRFREMRDVFMTHSQYTEVMDGMLAQKETSVASIIHKTMMGPEEVKALHNKGHIIGLHSHTHPTTMAVLPDSEQRSQYMKNITAITRVTGQAPFIVSHPSNSYSPRTLALLTELGIEFGFRANNEQPSYCALELPRVDHSTLMSEMSK